MGSDQLLVSAPFGAFKGLKYLDRKGVRVVYNISLGYRRERKNAFTRREAFHSLFPAIGTHYGACRLELTCPATEGHPSPTAMRDTFAQHKDSGSGLRVSTGVQALPMPPPIRPPVSSNAATANT